ncbi:hypothetical protein ACF3NA_09390 [Alkanindiges sp. WGS2144]|uniref:hypothetical protein n=1 Tax=Alkanindiges sp. WGS2144 TaxID=3366808 RepID=UPI0037527F7B
MSTIPVILYPVLAFMMAVIVGRIGTIIKAHFYGYEGEVSLDASNTAAEKPVSVSMVTSKPN